MALLSLGVLGGCLDESSTRNLSLAAFADCEAVISQTGLGCSEHLALHVQPQRVDTAAPCLARGPSNDGFFDLRLDLETQSMTFHYNRSAAAPWPELGTGALYIESGGNPVAMWWQEGALEQTVPIPDFFVVPGQHPIHFEFFVYHFEDVFQSSSPTRHETAVLVLWNAGFEVVHQVSLNESDFFFHKSAPHPFTGDPTSLIDFAITGEDFHFETNVTSIVHAEGTWNLTNVQCSIPANG